jgi:uncharacterized protein YyaL (SSP411 family)
MGSRCQQKSCCQERKCFVWTPEEIREVLGSDTDEFMAAYGVTRHGDFEGKNILEFIGDMDQRPALAEARHKLFEAREKRIHPGRDEKSLTSWNGPMIGPKSSPSMIATRAIVCYSAVRLQSPLYDMYGETNPVGN